MPIVSRLLGATVSAGIADRNDEELTKTGIDDKPDEALATVGVAVHQVVLPVDSGEPDDLWDEILDEDWSLHAKVAGALAATIG